MKQLYPRMGLGSLDGLEGNQFQVMLTVKSDAKSRTGQSLTGVYNLAANELTRFGDDWRVMGDLRWDQLPAGVVDEKDRRGHEI